MNKPQLKDTLTSILNADARSDLPSAIACLLAEVRRNQLETTQLRQEFLALKGINEDLLSQTKEMKTEISLLNAKIDPTVATISNEDAGLTQATPVWERKPGRGCSTIDNAVRTSVESAMQEQKHKCEVIVSKVEEKGQDEDLINDVCTKISFAHRPVEVSRLGKKSSSDTQSRLMKVSFATPFDARVFKARYEEARKRKDGSVPDYRMRFGRNEKEQGEYKAHSDLAHKLNEEAKKSKCDESYSLRNNGVIWQYKKSAEGKWTRVPDWSPPVQSGNEEQTLKKSGNEEQPSKN